MKIPLRMSCLVFFALGTGAHARAAYAPVPEVEQGKMLTFYVSGRVYHDTNIFGAPRNEISSMVHELQPTAVFNMSATPQTFLSASYQLTLDYFEDRPGDRTIASHSMSARVAHTFSPRLEGEISDVFQIVKNPESLLPGVSTVLNSDQSYNFNQLDGRLRYTWTKRTGLALKARAVDFAYKTGSIAEDIDHAEYLAGLEMTHAMREELQAVVEYRRRLIRYDRDGWRKDKDSDYLLAGADYALGKRSALTGRLGGEWIRRKGDDDSVVPYAELAWKHDYSANSYWSVGYAFSVVESSNLDLYTDSYTHRFFANIQHSLTPRLTASGSLNYEPGTLNGRKGLSEDRDETNLRVGAAVTYSISKYWAFSTTLDYDRIDSDDPVRELERLRGGASVRYVF
ncbi:outer membrane beta-barrel protein [Termitidicoccus mucosus]